MKKILQMLNSTDTELRILALKLLVKRGPGYIKEFSNICSGVNPEEKYTQLDFRRLNERRNFLTKSIRLNSRSDDDPGYYIDKDSGIIFFMSNMQLLGFTENRNSLFSIHKKIYI